MRYKRGKKKRRENRGDRGKSLSHGGTSKEQNLTVQINLESLHCRERAGEWRERRQEGRGEKDRENKETEGSERH